MTLVNSDTGFVIPAKRVRRQITSEKKLGIFSLPWNAMNRTEIARRYSCSENVSNMIRGKAHLKSRKKSLAFYGKSSKSADFPQVRETVTHSKL